MRVVLGIDAAWTAAQPSGVALVAGSGERWRCLALAPSYDSFLSGELDWSVRPRGGVADCDALIARATRLAGRAPDVIAIDMPLSTLPITKRREADNAISRAYGARGLGAHTPNEQRPGPIADGMRAGFARYGYTLGCSATRPGTCRTLLEVFPHAIAISLARASYRVPYKLSRIAQYWPEHSPIARRRALLAKWATLRRALATRIDDVQLRIPRTSTIAALKRYEDAMDALMCAWTGIEYFAGRVQPYGDETAAVWAPP